MVIVRHSASVPEKRRVFSVVQPEKAPAPMVVIPLGSSAVHRFAAFRKLFASIQVIPGSMQTEVILSMLPAQGADPVKAILPWP